MKQFLVLVINGRGYLFPQYSIEHLKKVALNFTVCGDHFTGTLSAYLRDDGWTNVQLIVGNNLDTGTRETVANLCIQSATPLNPDGTVSFEAYLVTSQYLEKYAVVQKLEPTGNLEYVAQIGYSDQPQILKLLKFS